MDIVSIIIIVLLVVAIPFIVWGTIRMQQKATQAALQAQQETMQATLRAQQEATQEALRTQRELFEKSIETLHQQVKNTTAEALKARQEEFSLSSAERLRLLLDPLKRDLEQMESSLTKNKEKQIELQTSMETQIRELLRQSNLTAQSANTLADALKNRGKVHGDWGEHVLEDILAGSGLREGYEYTIQGNVKDEENANFRPDVIINCPDGKHIIVDAKTSLTAYTEALGAETEIERDEAMKRHYKSVKDHVAELVKKQYQKLIDNSMPYVLMFIPNEGAYVMALNYDHSLLQDAYNKGVIIVNPSNLMLTLYLVLQAWQQTHQEDNCKRILTQAGKMYDKMITVVDSFTRLGGQIKTVNNTYFEAMKQLSEGRGNLLNQVEGLKELGVTSTKTRNRSLQTPTIPELEEAENTTNE